MTLRDALGDGTPRAGGGPGGLVRLGFACVATFGLVASAAACARQEAPPGGPEDLRPPVVVRTTPEGLSTVTDLQTTIRFEFDERVSERVSGGTLDDAISISPRVEEARVSHGRRSFSLEVDGGLSPGLVYRVTLNPVVSDMFGNTLADPFELVFSTGGDPVPTTVAGEAWDRVTGMPVREATVHLVGEDGLTHQAKSDRDGIFALRYLPEGDFRLTAFEDRNRDAVVDSTEVQGTVALTIAPGDTALVEVAMLEPDTAAAFLIGADPVDSVTVVLEFDDYLDPDVALDDARVRVLRDSIDARGVVRVFHEADYAEYVDFVADSFARLDSIDAALRAAEQAAARARADSLAAADSSSAADSAGGADPAAARDSLGPGADPASLDPAAGVQPGQPTPDDTVTVRPPGAPGQRPVGAPTGVSSEQGARARPAPGDPGGAQVEPEGPRRRPPTALQPLQGSNPGMTRDGRRNLPSRRLVALLDGPLEVEVEYEVAATGVVNLFGLQGGGGTATLLLPPPDPDSLAADTLGADTLGIDTLGVDTLGIDTLGVGVGGGAARSAGGEGGR